MLNHPLRTENKTEELAPSSATCEIEMISGMRPRAYQSETINFNAAFREATWSFGTRLLLTHRFSHKVKRGLVSNHFLPSAAFSLTKATFTDNNSSSCSQNVYLKFCPDVLKYLLIYFKACWGSSRHWQREVNERAVILIQPILKITNDHVVYTQPLRHGSK